MKTCITCKYNRLTFDADPCYSCRSYANWAADIAETPVEVKQTLVENNGGKTGYYDLPLPQRIDIEEVILKVIDGIITVPDAADEILALCPQTLNDLIEYKQMQPWQHEAMKATYALEARADKNGGSLVREINKIIYYAGRGLAIALRK